MDDVAFDVGLTPEVVGSNLPMHVDVALSSSGFKQATRGPSGLSWERSFGLPQSLAVFILGLIALSGIGNAPNGLFLTAIAVFVAVGVWVLRGPKRFQIVLNGTRTGTRITITDGSSTLARRAVETFVNSHGGVQVGDLRKSSNPSFSKDLEAPQ